MVRLLYSDKGPGPAYMVQDGKPYCFLKDYLGSPRLDYDTWGQVTQDTNPGFQPFGFAGGLYDHLTGLVRFGARDYDPATGWCTSEDSIGFAL